MLVPDGRNPMTFFLFPLLMRAVAHFGLERFTKVLSGVRVFEDAWPVQQLPKRVPISGIFCEIWGWNSIVGRPSRAHRL